MIFKDLLKENKQIVVELNMDNRKQFLKHAKNEGFKWISNKEIQENEDCSFLIAIRKDGYIANISGMCYANSKELKALPRYKY